MDSGRAFGAQLLVDVGAYEYQAPALLAGLGDGLSLALGGTQALVLDAGTVHAGQLYLVLGTTSGDSP